MSKQKANTTELHPKVRKTCLCTESPVVTLHWHWLDMFSVLSVIKHKHWRQLYCSDKRGYIQLHLTLVHTVLLLKVLKNE